MNLRVAVDLTAEAAVDAYLAAGIERQRIAVCDTAEQAAAA